MIMKGRNVSIEVKRGLRNSIFLSTLPYGSDLSTVKSAYWGNEVSERGNWVVEK